MEEFLSMTVANLKSGNYSTLTLVVGNERCDLDSAVSTLVYASFQRWRHQQIQCAVCTRHSPGCKEPVFVPVLNVDRGDFEVKTEVEYCLRERNISEDLLVFRNDFNLEELITKTETKVILVDHHTLNKKDVFLAPFVTEIIDHRPVDKTEWKYRNDTRYVYKPREYLQSVRIAFSTDSQNQEVFNSVIVTTIEAVGSCCTLVAQRITDQAALMSKQTVFFETYPQCTLMLHSTIILDTVNFSKEVKKGTPHDLEVVLLLEGMLKLENPVMEREAKLARLQAARSDVSRLTAAQLLKKDAKIVREVYVASFPILVQEFLLKPGALPAVTEVLQTSGCSLALLLGMTLQNGLERDVAICGSESDSTAKLAKFLQDWSSPSLRLATTGPAPSPVALHFNQLNLCASRKQYISAVNAFLLNA